MCDDSSQQTPTDGDGQFLADAVLFVQVLRAEAQGDETTREQRRGAKRFERAFEARVRERLLRAVPKLLWCRLSGTTHQRVKDVAELCSARGFEGTAVDLAAFLSWFYRWIAEVKPKLERLDADFDSTEAEKRQHEVRLKKAAADKLEMGNRLRRGELVEVRVVRACFQALRDALSQMVTQVGQMHGPAAALIEQKLEAMAAVVGRELGADTPDAGDGETDGDQSETDEQQEQAA